MSEENKWPTHSVFSVLNFGQEGKRDASWVKIGAAWMHKDGKGFDLIVETTPKKGEIVLRLNEANESPEAGGRYERRK
jgi:hypothetical protein